MKVKTISREEILYQLRQMKKYLKERYGIQKIGVFGSVARNNADSESDIDIVVEMEPNLFLRAGLKAELEKHFGQKVDVVRYRKSMKKSLKKRIDNESIYV